MVGSFCNWRDIAVASMYAICRPVANRHSYRPELTREMMDRRRAKQVEPKRYENRCIVAALGHTKKLPLFAQADWWCRTAWGTGMLSDHTAHTHSPHSLTHSHSWGAVSEGIGVLPRALLLTGAQL